MKSKPEKKPPGGYVCAVKVTSTKGNAWMPTRCAVHLEGAALGTFLEIAGFTIEDVYLEALKTRRVHMDSHVWPLKRLEKVLPKLKKRWREEYGPGWALEIKPV